jgi:2-polyprenyl-6-methoxyphenol hydroxylase-like FAD-dependent oxidoreductase
LNSSKASNSTKHAVVIGGSMAGMMTAQVLANHFEQVTIIERDKLPEEIQPRKGVPQGRHPHGLLKRGEIILEQLFPGIVDELKADGAVKINFGSEVAWHSFGAWRPRFEASVDCLNCSRPMLEAALRRHIKANPRVQFIEESEVIALEANSANNRATGVWLRQRNLKIHNASLLAADLVVDASGRDSHAPKWLEELGYVAPLETVVNCQAGYATRIYQKSADFNEDWQMLMMQPLAPDQKRGILLLPLEGNKEWHVTLIGMAGDYPPIDEAGFLEFARSLPDSKAYEVLLRSEPLTPIVGFRRADNRLRHYHEMPVWLENFLVTGDAVCALNPIYGQGMTVAAIEALELDACLTEHQIKQSNLTENFQKRLYKATLLPWQMATNEDRRWFPQETVEFDPEARLMEQYMGQLIRTTCTNLAVMDVFLRVMHMLEAPTIFFRPDIVLQVFNEMMAASVS